MTRDTVRWERMLPQEFRQAIQRLPVCFLPLGTVEWHGEHNALGLDSVKAHTLCIHAAQRTAGGVVHPPLYGGMGGLDMPMTVVMEPEQTWENLLLRPWLEKLCMEFHRQGFKGIVILTGHYGHNQQIVVREVATRMTERLQIPVYGAAEYWLAWDAGYLGDHAGVGETSLLWHLHPDLVDIERLDQDPVYGKDGTLKKKCSPELGKKYADLITDRLARLARAMLTWTPAQLAQYIRAERAIVSAQITAWRRSNDAWAAWRILKSERPDLHAYGALIATSQFAKIEEFASKLWPST